MIFVNYRRHDDPFAVGLLAAVLYRVFPGDAVYLDTVGNPKARRVEETLQAALDRAGVLVCVIGPGWDRGENLERLADPEDWVRWEIDRASKRSIPIIPVLVNRARTLDPQGLPSCLRHVAEDSPISVHRNDVLAGMVPVLEVVAPFVATPPSSPPVVIDRDLVHRAMELMLRHALPLTQQQMGNRQRIVDSVAAALRPGEWLRYLVTGRLSGRPSGSAVLVLTDSRLFVVDLSRPDAISRHVAVDDDTSITIEPHQRLWRQTAHVQVHRAGDSWQVKGIFREQAERLCALRTETDSDADPRAGA